MKKYMRSILFALMILMMTGCMGYKLGGSQPEGIRHVYLNKIINKTSEPAIEIQLEHALRSRIQFDGRLKLTALKDADAIIDVTLTQYKLRAISFRRQEQTTAQEYRVRLDASAQLKNRETSAVVSKAKNYGESTFEFTSDLTTSKRSASREVAEDLAKYILDDLIEQW